MKRILLAGALALTAGATVAAEPMAAAPGPVLRDAAHDPAWRELFAQLAPDRTRTANFVERRFFPFHQNPIVLTGDIRIDPERGLSLHYLTPEPNTLIVDRQGIVLRDAQGRTRAPPSTGTAQAVTTALVAVLRFNLPELEKDFGLRGRRTGDEWALTLVPRDPALAGSLASVVVSGAKASLGKIELNLSATQRIEILISTTQENVVFSPADLSRYFR